MYREQQKAAWRAQRDAWRAQRHAWKAGFVGDYYPRVPSVVGPLILVAVGIIALLIYAGRLDSGTFWAWYGRWWPLLLILAGVAMLGEWALDMRRKTPVRRGGSFVGILILLAIIGVCSAWGHSNWDWMRHDFGDSDDFFNMFGRPQHDLDQQVLNSNVPANAVVDIENPRGDVSITAGDTQTVQVEAHEVAYADSDASAKRIFDAEAAHVQVSGNAVHIRSDGSDSGRVNLTVIIPRTAQIAINDRHGDVTASGLSNGATITAGHGEVHLSAIQGSVQVHFSTDRGDFSAHQVTGDITADGRCNDVTLSEVTGKVTITGELQGNVHMEKLSGPVHLHTSITDLVFGELPGDMTLDDEDLRITEARGKVTVTTHSKNIDLTQIYGDTFVQDRDGNISISPAGPYSVEAHSTSGEGNLDVTLPPNASGTVDGRTHNGEIEVVDFPLTVSGDTSKTVIGRIGSGSGKITLSTDTGDIHIKRGSGFPPPSESSPSTSSASEPGEPPPAHARHLTPPKNSIPKPQNE
jgi:DUF4097 and DUF4098 domain-containing protein YvlB